jgi:hypothetical protein
MKKPQLINNMLMGILAISFSFIFCDKTHANIVFPAIAQQFMASVVIRSYWSVVLAALIVIIETIFLKRLLSLNSGFSFLASFAVNLISSVCGIIIVTVLPIYHKGSILAYSNMRLGTYLGLLPGYLLTIVLEGLVLVWIARLIAKKVNISRCMKMSAIMNLISYLILLVGIVIADVMTGGQNFKIN